MNVLFIGNDASRTGAPIGLLHLLRWLRAGTDCEYSLLLRKGGGPLQAEYERLCPVTGYDTLSSERGLLRRAARRLGRASLWGRDCRSAAERLYADGAFDLIYANTITVGGIIADLAMLRKPVLCHVHELESTIQAYGPLNVRHVRRHAARYLADSHATRRNLIDNHRIPHERIEVAYEFIACDEVTTGEDPAAVRARLGIPAGAPIVGGCGYRYRRKGKDLFVRLARALRAIAPRADAHFVWVGGNADDAETNRLRADIAAAGVGDRMHVVPHVDDPAPLFSIFDVLALTSREEPFGMVMLEAACFGCPTLCFAEAGGPREFVEDDAGRVVHGINVEMMAERLAGLLADPVLRTRLGKRARKKARERHDVSVVAPAIVRAMRQVAAMQPARRSMWARC